MNYEAVLFYKQQRTNQDTQLPQASGDTASAKSLPPAPPSSTDGEVPTQKDVVSL